MRWYQHLFWKIFASTWLVSTLLMGGLTYGLLTLSEQRHWHDVLHTRATSEAQFIIERYEDGLLFLNDPRHVRGRLSRISVQVTDIDENKELISFRRHLPPEAILSFTMETDSGKRYLVEIPIPQERFHLVRMLRFTLSIQMISVMLVAGLIALLLSVWIVRPINQLRQHARNLYDQQNLSSRAKGRLSRRTDEIGELAREFNRMADYVENTLTDRERLLQDVSHELRAPLARLQMAVGLVEQSLGEEHKSLVRINKECDYMSRLIDEILSFSRIGCETLYEPPYALSVLLEQLLQDVQPLKKAHRLLITTPSDTMMCNYRNELLLRMLSNALVNALKYTPPDGEIELKIELEGERLHFKVLDNGPGVSEELLETLMEPFVRGKTSGVSDGYGLGLSIIKRGAECFGGELKIANRVEGGFSLDIALPFDPINKVC
ncbi:sensor histidine kinase [Nitrincola alkalisediminis]|uniref:sensor histidine kinase n=1 Tax=Nitrincola alkalisediminis TaxID=1366656 RepID=UPI001874F83B|nr:HAMP domain-containing sensor histidine kinase [Nitrincola alkalisediminis]